MSKLARVECFLSRITDPYTNLALEDWLFQQKTASSYVLFLYRNSPSVIIGRNQNPWRECNLRLIKDHHVPLVRRRSGGGTVYHDLGNTNYSLMMPRQDFSRSRGVQLICRALHQLDIPASENTRHDITISDRKVSGSAFKIVNDRAYHHGTMLIHSNLSHLKQYLAKDAKSGLAGSSIQGRGVESIASPVTRLANHSLTITHLGFVEAVVDEFVKSFGGRDVTWSGLDYERAATTAKGDVELKVLDDEFIEEHEEVAEGAESLKTWDWTFGQTPLFTHTLSPLSTAKGIVQATFTVDNGIIVDSAVTGLNAEIFKGQRYDASSLETWTDTLDDDIMNWFKREIT
ncbi:hypothetical protein SmJEL517_g03916 [Synchytrium microbalum]|uniref:Putative lipoate-protein ligase A n=1 Tax=Synchytrium microbalum TaxID=1806994 RepID=A0A507C6C8_9FUNG|nr:uncharacterized protein SmJEL517_g03916 [Synchytrium microbalum]TPX33103.1 hypothetical protein SmJEL517_g03916 [Synchytrium microbalum]